MTPQTAPPDPKQVSDSHAAEVASGERFEFGKNWQAFLSEMNEASIEAAVRSLKEMLGVESLVGRTFLDIGSGSGLFSLAAHKLGADVTSFDYDPYSVACTTELRRRYGARDARWRILSGSVLDLEFMESLGAFEVVYSWGVLHHTGQMWNAIWNAASRVADGGKFFIAIYNDQGAWSARWVRIKRFYCSGPVGKALVTWSFIPFWVARDFAADLVWRRNPLARYRDYGDETRGMRVFRDYHDWLGGYPFEYATPEGIILPLMAKGFRLTNLRTARGSVGCVEYVFRRGSTDE